MLVGLFSTHCNSTILASFKSFKTYLTCMIARLIPNLGKHFDWKTWKPLQWKGSNHKQSTRWQHITQLKALVHYVFGKINYGGLKHNSLYLGLILPSGGWQSIIQKACLFYKSSFSDAALRSDHRHLSNIDCLTARTACLVCFISTVNGRSKKRKEAY
jgi:hypothetical protein